MKRINFLLPPSAAPLRRTTVQKRKQRRVLFILSPPSQKWGQKSERDSFTGKRQLADSNLGNGGGRFPRFQAKIMREELGGRGTVEGGLFLLLLLEDGVGGGIEEEEEEEEENVVGSQSEAEFIFCLPLLPFLSPSRRIRYP